MGLTTALGLGGAGASALAGGLGNTNAARTPAYTPNQQKLQSQLYGNLSSGLGQQSGLQNQLFGNMSSGLTGQGALQSQLFGNLGSGLGQQSGLQNQLFSTIGGMLQNPGNNPALSALSGPINQNYKNLANQMSVQAQARGFGGSGMLPANLQQIDFARQGAIGQAGSGLYSQMLQNAMGLNQNTLQNATGLNLGTLSAGMGLNQNTLQNAMGYGFANPGQPGSAAAGALSGAGAGLGNLAGILSMAGMFGGF